MLFWLLPRPDPCCSEVKGCVCFFARHFNHTESRSARSALLGGPTMLPAAAQRCGAGARVVSSSIVSRRSSIPLVRSPSRDSRGMGQGRSNLLHRVSAAAAPTQLHRTFTPAVARAGVPRDSSLGVFRDQGIFGGHPILPRVDHCALGLPSFRFVVPLGPHDAATLTRPPLGSAAGCRTACARRTRRLSPRTTGSRRPCA